MVEWEKSCTFAVRFKDSITQIRQYMNRLITKQETAKMLGCSQQTVSNWVESGFITGHKVGKHLMIDRNSIVRYFDKIKDLLNMEQKLAEMRNVLHDEFRRQQALIVEAKIDELQQLRNENKVLKEDNDRLLRVCINMKERLHEYEDSNKFSTTVFEKPLADYHISVRSLNKLKSIGCLTVGDLVKNSRKDMEDLFCSAPKTFEDADGLLNSLGLYWGMKLDRMPQTELRKWSIV